MQDNYNHTDPEFTDRSWSEMKKLLDREMPAQAIPFWRKKGLLWLFLLLVPFSAALGFYHFLWKNGPETPTHSTPAPVPVPQKPVAFAETPENCPDAALLPAPVAAGTPAISSSQAQTASLAIAPASTPDTWITTAKPGENNHFFTAFGLLPTHLQSVASLYRLPATDFQAPATVSRLPLSPPLSLSVEAGAFASGGLQSAGVSAGLGVSYAFGKSAWGIRTGLGYSYFNNPFPVAALTQNNRAEDFSNLVIGPGNTPVSFDTSGAVEALASSADSTVSRLHYLDIPLVVTRQLGKRWQVQAGAAASLLLTARTQMGDDAGFGLVSANKVVYTDDQTEFSGAEAASALSRLRVANPTLQAGIAFLPHPDWQVGLQVNAGLMDAMPDWPGRQLLNKVQLKVGYRF